MIHIIVSNHITITKNLITVNGLINNKNLAHFNSFVNNKYFVIQKIDNKIIINLISKEIY